MTRFFTAIAASLLVLSLSSYVVEEKTVITDPAPVVTEKVYVEPAPVEKVVIEHPYHHHHHHTEVEVEVK